MEGVRTLMSSAGGDGVEEVKVRVPNLAIVAICAYASFVQS